MEELYTKIPPEIIKPLPVYQYEGKIILVQTRYEMSRAIAILEKSPILGIDTETRPSYNKYRQNKVCLLQIANEELCFLFRLNLLRGLPQDLANLLENPDIIKVGLGLNGDFKQLRKHLPTLKPQAIAELQKMATDMGIADQALVKLYANFFRLRICKNQTMSNWENPMLTDAQKTYAATDAVVCLHLYHRMRTLQESDDYILIPPAEKKKEHKKSYLVDENLRKYMVTTPYEEEEEYEDEAWDEEEWDEDQENNEDDNTPSPSSDVEYTPTAD